MKIHPEILKLVLNEESPTCPFCDRELLPWKNKDHPPDFNFYCTCIYLFTIDSFDLPRDEDSIYLDVIRFQIHDIELHLSFDKTPKMMIRVEKSGYIITEDEMPEFNFKDVPGMKSKIDKYILFS